MAASMTYTSLLADLSLYAERLDDDFTNQRARFIAQAENRISAEARGLGFLRAITDNLVATQSYLIKPDRWRETASLQIGTGSGNNTRVLLLLRSYEYCRTYWPDATQTGTPKYYADWDYSHLLLVPTPVAASPYELLYHERPEPLDAEHQTNWVTQYAPHLLLYATLLEAQPFLKRDDRIAVFQQEYDRALKQVAYEQQRRVMDRSQSTSNA